MTVGWVAAGLALSVVSGIVRIRAWYAAVADACPAECGRGPGGRIRYRDVVMAHLGGAGFNGLLPVHGGDAIKLGLLRRRNNRLGFGVLVGTLAPPAAVEALCTALLLGWALSNGIVDTDGPGQIPLPLVGLGATLAAVALWLLARRTPRILRGVRTGMAALRRPRLLLTGVAPWVLAARAMRLASIACFIAALGLPGTLAGALVVMAVQGGVGSFGPATAPMRMAVLAASLPAALGVSHVSFTTAATLLGGMQLTTLATTLTISVIVLAITLRTVSPRRLLSHAREAAAGLRPSPAPQPAPRVTEP
jgi:hypothetical protein